MIVLAQKQEQTIEEAKRAEEAIKQNKQAEGMGTEVGERGGPFLVPLWHCVLMAQASLPLVIEVPAELNIVCTALLTVLVGCWRSVKPQGPTDTMSKKVSVVLYVLGMILRLGGLAWDGMWVSFKMPCKVALGGCAQVTD